MGNVRMICRECISQIPDESTFCLNCGERLIARTPRGEEALEAPPAALTFPWLKVLAPTVLILAVLIGFYFFRQTQQIPRVGGTVIPAAAPSGPAPYWERASTALETKALTVEAQRFAIQEITVPQEWKNTRFYCKFRAHGGSGNDIKAYVTNADGLENLKNNHTFNIWYSSDKVTVGTIDIRLSPGQYYLVFSNTFSLLSNKEVTAEIQMHYEYLKQP